MKIKKRIWKVLHPFDVQIEYKPEIKRKKNNNKTIC